MSTPLDMVEPLLAGELAPEQVEELEAWLAQSDANRLAFIESVQLCREIRRALLAADSGVVIDGLIEDDENEPDVMGELIDLALADRRRHEVEERARRLLNENQATQRTYHQVSAPPEPRHPRRTIVIPIPVAVAAAAAAVVLVAVVLWPKAAPPPSGGGGGTVAQPSEPPPTPRSVQTPTPVASVRLVNRPQWSANGASQEPDADGRMPAGRYELTAGDIELRLDGGAVLLIEGPAQFELLDDNRSRLLSGRLTATVGESVAGFELDTPTARFQDVQATFGVGVGSTGQTEAHIHRGQLEVMGVSTAGSSRSLVLREREGVVVTPEGHTPRRSEVLPEQFALDMTALTGKPVLVGEADYLNAAPRTVVMNQGVQSPRARIFLESTQRPLRRGTSIATAYPGRSAVITNPRGRVVDSYLVVFDPVDETNRFKTVNFEATFPGRVISVITEDDDLAECRGWYGRPETWYGDETMPVDGLEAVPGQAGNPEFVPDTIELSEDGRTMRVFLGVHDGADVFRVLVEREDRAGMSSPADSQHLAHADARLSSDIGFIRPISGYVTSPQLVAASISLKGENR